MTRPAALVIEVRPATSGDSPAIAALLAVCGLPVDGLEDAWRTWVAVAAGQVVGAAALERHDGALLLRSVAVAPQVAGAGLGTRLVRTALLAADGIGAVALLTETAAAWFPRFGFVITPRDQLPQVLASSAQVAHACPASATAMIRPPPARQRVEGAQAGHELDGVAGGDVRERQGSDAGPDTPRV